MLDNRVRDLGLRECMETTVTSILPIDELMKEIQESIHTSQQITQTMHRTITDLT